MMEADLQTIIVDDEQIKALVPAGNVRINFVPQGAPSPAIAIYRISGGPGYTFDGPDGLTDSRVQIDVRGADRAGNEGSGYAQAYPVAERLRALLSGYRGIVGNTNFRLITILSERQRSEKPGSEVFHTFSLDFQVWHRAT